MKHFYCKKCKYTTTNKSNFNRHLKSNRHLEKCNSCLNVNSKNSRVHSGYTQGTLSSTTHKCLFCDENFKTKQSLSNHKKSCEEKNNIINEYERQLKDLKKESYLRTENYKEKMEIYKSNYEYFKNALAESGSLLKASINNTGKILNYCKDNKHIEFIDPPKLEYFEDDDEIIIKNLISSYKHKTLCKTLGNIILGVYKKSIDEQSIFTTDKSRLTFLIKELLQDNTSELIIDKRGIKASGYIVEPLLKHIRNILQNRLETSFTIDDIDSYSTENVKIISNIIIEIDDENLNKKILKYLSPYLVYEETEHKHIS